MTDAPMPPETPRAATTPTPEPAEPATAQVPELPKGKFEFSTITKSIVYVLSMIVAVGTPILAYTTNILPEKAALIIAGIVGVSGSILHYIAPNTTTNPDVAQTQSVRLK